MSREEASVGPAVRDFNGSLPVTFRLDPSRSAEVPPALSSPGFLNPVFPRGGIQGPEAPEPSPPPTDTRHSVAGRVPGEERRRRVTGTAAKPPTAVLSEAAFMVQGSADWAQQGLVAADDGPHAADARSFTATGQTDGRYAPRRLRGGGKVQSKCQPQRTEQSTRRKTLANGAFVVPTCRPKRWARPSMTSTPPPVADGRSGKGNDVRWASRTMSGPALSR